MHGRHDDLAASASTEGRARPGVAVARGGVGGLVAIARFGVRVVKYNPAFWEHV